MGTQQKKKKRTEDSRSLTGEIKRTQDLDVNKLALEPTFELGYSPFGVGTVSFVNVSSGIIFGVQTSATDTIAPLQVTGLNATPVSNTVINLTWTANSEPDLSLYNVYRGTTSGFTVTPGVTTPTGTPSTNSYSDTGRITSTIYYYKVAAVDTSGNIGSLSTEDSATTFPLPLAQITGLTVTAQAGSNTQLNLAWTANTAPNFNYYNVYRGPSGFTPSPSLRIAQPTINSYANTGLNTGTTYYYKVAAVDINTQEGPASVQVGGTTTSPPPTPPPSPSMWLAFDNNYNDGSGNNATVNSRHMAGNSDFSTANKFGGYSLALNWPNNNAGTSDRVRIDKNANTSPTWTQPFSYSFWVQPKDLASLGPDKVRSLLCHWDSSSDSLLWLFITPDGYLQWFLRFSDNSNSYSYSPIKLVTATWSHIVITVNPSTKSVKVYQDKTDVSGAGNVAESTGWETNLPEFWTGVQLGYASMPSGDPDYTSYFEGYIDELRFYQGVILTPSQVISLYNTNGQ